MYPLLLLPDLLNDARVWQSCLTELQQDRACAVYPTYLEEGVEAIAAAAIETMPNGPFCVAGFSLGGYVALEVCRQAGDRIKGLALLSTGGRSESETGREFRLRMIETARHGSDQFETTARSFLPRLLSPQHADDLTLVSSLAEMARAVGGAGFVRQQLTALGRPDSLHTLDRVRVPSLVLCGLDDQITPVSLSEEMAGKLQDVELVKLTDCGHMVTLEQPGETCAALQAWLQRCGS